MSAPVTAGREGEVHVIRLTRADRRNALDPNLADALATALEDAGDAGAVTLLADGEHFCVGGDVRAMAGAHDREAFVGDLATTFHRAIRAMRSGPPVVVAARGSAAGAGMSLLLAADLVVAGESLTMRPAYPAIGLTPDGGMTWTLARAVGERRARAILLRNDALGAEEATWLGLVDQVVPDAEVEDTALALAARLAAGPRQALAGAKRLVMDGLSRTLDQQLDAEASHIAAHAAMPDGREGVDAFSERRAPTFGR